MKSPTSILSNALSTISIAHAYRRRSSPKQVSWKQNSTFWKSKISNFSDQTHRNFCPERKFQPSLLRNILWLYTLIDTLSNALSTTFIRHLYLAASSFKPTCKKSNFQNSCFWHFQKTHPTQEEFRHHKIIFVFLRYYFNRNFIDHAFESYFIFKIETHIFEAFFAFAKRIIKVLKRLSFWQK